MARNAGLMGLAATAIALGVNDVGRYLRTILPPVLACFGDQNDQVRFYACESLYNIAKIAKGEILVYFNEIFDVLCKISADTENSVRGAAELLDRLIKDIVAERASNYVSIVNNNPRDIPPVINMDPLSGNVYQNQYKQDDNLAFSLPKFIPLLSERIYAINPDTRVFLIQWLNVLLNTPGLELMAYLPSFLGGLFTFLGDSHKDVRTMTHALMDILLHEVEQISQLQLSTRQRQLETTKALLEKKLEKLPPINKKNDGALIAEKKKSLLNALEELSSNDSNVSEKNSTSLVKDSSVIQEESHDELNDIEHLELDSLRDGEEYIPGQDIHLNFPEIIAILVNNLASSETEIQLIALRWMDTILSISAIDFIPFFSNILSVLLKLLSDSDPHVNELAHSFNGKLLSLCSNLDQAESDKSNIAYGSILNNLTLQFFDGQVEAKVAYLDWLSLIYQKAPNQILEHNDSLFLTLLKSLSHQDTRLIEKALDLLKNLCSDSNDDYLKKFLQDFLNLLKRDSKLLKTRANYIIGQICVKLSPERVYRTISSLLNSCDDLIFVRMMIQILSNILITSPEMHYLRNKLRSGDDRILFNILFKSWCHNSVSLISLCLVSESYELAYSVLQNYANYEIKVSDLVQLDILVQLFESPVFTRMRLQLLEQQKYPYLYKCLYAILMILPQTKAFEILNRRLSSANIWISQPYPNLGMTKTRNSSSSSVGINGSNISDISQRSVSQNKLYYQELLDHFNNTVEKEQAYLENPVSSKEPDLPLLGTFMDVPEDRSFASSVAAKVLTPSMGGSIHADEAGVQPIDNSSVIYQPTPSARGSTRSINTGTFKTTASQER
ncbi:hypothetical protein NCAS_0J01420 [Naumovozyma castellii]|uniref:Vacuolar protein 14 C-terminal Fig4-binding domain-containing protein n=1 Tax=Naumovozyma castellii TaxID=27288 RepID=G0VKT3_NAUCA|nr:hypothetical protein NCAS_0J01420 [Naumovozyma castellii CBS 4309]CCC72121.1 hypothetical protein NCAS_0J01420 [Naumovozyma castellii CBS 4309]